MPLAYREKSRIRGDADIFRSIELIYRAISAHSFSRDSEYSQSEVDVVGDSGRVKKRKRPWLSMEGSEFPDLPLLDVEIPPSLTRLPLDKWAPNKRFSVDRLETWGAQGAVNCQVIW